MRGALWMLAGTFAGWAFMLALANLADDRAREAEADASADRDEEPEYVEDFELDDGPPIENLIREMREHNAVPLTEDQERELSQHLTPLDALVRARDVTTDAKSIADEASVFLDRWERGEKP